MNTTISPTSQTFQSAEFIHRFIPATDGPFKNSVLLLLHGTGGDENSLLGLGQALAPGAALLSPRGQVLEHGSVPRFFRRLAEGVFDEDDLRARAAGLAEFVRASAERYGFSVSQVIALGFSNGANIAAATLLLHPEAVGGAVLLRAMVPLEPDATTAHSPGLPVLLNSGRHDPMVPAANANHLAELLRANGVTLTHHWENSGHDLNSGDFAAIQDWLSANATA